MTGPCIFRVSYKAAVEYGAAWRVFYPVSYCVVFRLSLFGSVPVAAIGEERGFERNPYEALHWL